jgi:hypothetical protein
MSLRRSQARDRLSPRVDRLDLRADGIIAAHFHSRYPFQHSQNPISAANKLPFLVAGHDTGIGSGLCGIPYGSDILPGEISRIFSLC